MASDLGRQPAASRQEQVADLSGEGSWLACSSVAEAVDGADAALILTEWQEFRQLPWQELAGAPTLVSARRDASSYNFCEHNY